VRDSITVGQRLQVAVRVVAVGGGVAIEVGLRLKFAPGVVKIRLDTGAGSSGYVGSLALGAATDAVVFEMGGATEGVGLGEAVACPIIGVRGRKVAFGVFGIEIAATLLQAYGFSPTPHGSPPQNHQCHEDCSNLRFETEKVRNQKQEKQLAQ